MIDHDKKLASLVTLLDNSTSEDEESPIINREIFGKHSLHVSEDAGGSVSIFVSNSPTSEEVDIEFVQYGVAIIQSQLVVIDAPFRWIKVVRDATTFPISVHLLSTELNHG